MADARGDALEWALALARAPGERLTLRQRPLPDGIEPLLQIAAGKRGEVLQTALARSGEPEEALVEAVRFYLREVLLHSGADAYRMLGLSPDASAEQIKSHHRVLQQWLHPDRHTSDWDAIFAGRVNAAWNALRTPEHRAEYDRANPVAASARSLASRPPPRVVPVPLAEGAGDGRWRRRAPVLALFAACALLGVAAVRDALRPPESGYAADAREGERPRADAADPVALRLPVATKPVKAPKHGSSADSQRAAPRAVAPMVVAEQRSDIEAGIAEVAVFDITEPEPAEPVVARASAPAPTPAPAPALSQRSSIAPSEAAVAQTTSRPPIAAPLPAEASTRPTPVAAVVATPAVPAPQPIAPEAAVPSARASVEQVQQAQRTGRELMAFLSSRGARVPPIWDSMAAQQRALGLRERLHASGELRPGEPHWRVGSKDAALQALFGEDSNVRAQLVWREQRWLVSGVALEDAP